MQRFNSQGRKQVCASSCKSESKTEGDGRHGRIKKAGSAPSPFGKKTARPRASKKADGRRAAAPRRPSCIHQPIRSDRIRSADLVRVALLALARLLVARARLAALAAALGRRAVRAAARRGARARAARAARARALAFVGCCFVCEGGGGGVCVFCLGAAALLVFPVGGWRDTLSHAARRAQRKKKERRLTRAGAGLRGARAPVGGALAGHLSGVVGGVLWCV